MFDMVITAFNLASKIDLLYGPVNALAGIRSRWPRPEYDRSHLCFPCLYSYAYFFLLLCLARSRSPHVP